MPFDEVQWSPTIQVLDLGEVVWTVKSAAGPQARVVADGVAFAPHLPIDVSAWGVDWCVIPPSMRPQRRTEHQPGASLRLCLCDMLSSTVSRCSDG